jgi:hypothetical protein
MCMFFVICTAVRSCHVVWCALFLAHIVLFQIRLYLDTQARCFHILYFCFLAGKYGCNDANKIQKQANIKRTKLDTDGQLIRKGGDKFRLC